MVKELKIEPITRLEGHGDVKIILNDDDTVQDVKLMITSTRFFEKFAEGRQAEFLPRITPRICGICPIPHHIAPTKAIEDAWGIEIPPAAKKLRQLMMNAKQYASHALHFFALAAPDFLYGPLAPPEKRNVVSVIKALPDVGAMALKMMDFGQTLCTEIGGKVVHPVTAVPGGMTKVLTEDARDKFLAQIDEQVDFAKKTVELGLKIVNDYMDVVKNVAVVPTYYIGLTNNGVHDIYEGKFRVMSPEGDFEDFEPRDYLDAIAEHIAPHSYATHVYAKKAGYPDGLVTANCLARLNCVDSMATPLAQAAFEEFRNLLGRPCHAQFASHYARLIELVEALEMVATLLKDPEITSTDIKNPEVQAQEGMGVGIVEAPRGSLIYNIWTDGNGIIKKLNQIVATNSNIGSVEMILKKTAKAIYEDKVLDSLQLPKPMLE
ncbi:MAG TPA: Ni/Fe hydrogenase subunit alpha [Candidatus Lokiarchaeia archaeon]|nr:Ni/Fe hydrogenase subunit alpha [Candidatus Lokiarchaeia archaeon]